MLEINMVEKAEEMSGTLDYIIVEWLHDFKEEPIKIYVEVDKDKYEVRKVEFFRDGKRGICSRDIELGGTMFSTKPYPAFEEIDNDPEFKLSFISMKEFEKVWEETNKHYRY